MTSTRRPISELERAVAAQLRAHRASRQVKQDDIAAALDSHRTHVSRVLNGHAHIDLNELAIICETLGVSVIDVMAAATRAVSARGALLDEVDERKGPAVHATSDKISGGGLGSTAA